ncbi:cytochrome c oxidase subunit 4 [Mariniluteicoccus endophyticus]
MKKEAWIYLPLAGFFGLMTVVYYFLGRFDGGKIEWAGILTLALSCLMILMIGGFYSITGAKMDLRPEDRKEAEVAEGAGEIGFFPPASIWPLVCAVIVGLVFLGPVFGWWLTIIGFGLGVWAVGGWVYQYYRGDYSH